MSHQYLQYEPYQQQNTKLFVLMCKIDVDWPKVIETCTKDKSLARVTDLHGRTPLHTACCLRRCTLATIQALIKAHRKAIVTPDESGKLPIHYICDRRRRNWGGLRTRMGGGAGGVDHAHAFHENGNDDETIDILHELIRLYPESVMHQDDSGHTPLHICCNQPLSGRGLGQEELQQIIESISSLIKANPDVIFVKDRLKRTALHIAIINSLCEKIIHVLLMMTTTTATLESSELSTSESHPSTSSTASSIKKLCVMEDVKGYCPLHYACSNIDVAKGCVNLLVGACNDARKIRSHKGLTCLELLTMTYKEHINNPSSSSDTPTCIDYWEKSLILMYGRAPLDGRPRSVTEEEEELTYDCTNTSTKTNPSHPYHAVLHDMISIDRCPPLLIQFALKLHPNLIHETDVHGNLPIHVAASKRISRSQKASSNHILIIRHLLEVHPDACRICNNDNKFPLQVAAECGKTFQNGFREIFVAYPEAMMSLLETMPDSLLPHALAKLGLASTGGLSSKGKDRGRGKGSGDLGSLYTILQNAIPTNIIIPRVE